MLFLRLVFTLSLGLFLGSIYLYFEPQLFSPPLHDYPTPVKPQVGNYNQCDKPIEIEPIMVVTHREETLAHASGAWIKTPLGDNYFITNAHAVLSERYLEENVQTANPSTIEEVIGNSVITLHHKGTTEIVRAHVVSIINRFDTQELLSQNGYTYFKFNPLADVAILKVDDLPASFTQGLTQLPLATDLNLPVKLQSTGYKPVGLGHVAKYDLCRYVMYDDDSIAFLDQTEHAISGMSGSPWVNEMGEIVGLLMISGKLNSSENRFTASHIEDGQMFLAFSHIYPETLNTYAFATPVKWVYLALEMAK